MQNLLRPAIFFTLALVAGALAQQQNSVNVEKYLAEVGSNIKTLHVPDSLDRKRFFGVSSISENASVFDWIQGGSLVVQELQSFAGQFCSENNDTALQKVPEQFVKCRATKNQYNVFGRKKTSEESNAPSFLVARAGLGLVQSLSQESKELKACTRKFADCAREESLWNNLINSVEKDFSLSISSRTGSALRPKYILRSTGLEERPNLMVGITERDLWCGETERDTFKTVFGVFVRPRTAVWRSPILVGHRIGNGSNDTLSFTFRMLITQYQLHNISGSGAPMREQTAAFIFNRNGSSAVVPFDTTSAATSFDRQKEKQLRAAAVPILNLTKSVYNSRLADQVSIPRPLSEMLTLNSAAQAIDKNVRSTSVTEWALACSSALLSIGGIIGASTEVWQISLFLVLLQAFAGYLAIGFALSRGVERAGIYVSPIEKYVGVQSTQVLSDVVTWARCMVVESTYLTVVTDLKGNVWQVVTIVIVALLLTGTLIWKLVLLWHILRKGSTASNKKTDALTEDSPTSENDVPTTPAAMSPASSLTE